MNQATHLPLAQTGIRWLWISAVVILVDQLTKLWVVNTMTLEETIPVLPVFSIHRTYNEGAAWSMFANAGGIQRWIFSALAAVVWLRRLALSSQALLIAGLTLILGGAIGNLIDRLYLGHVIDFLLFYWNTSRFPAFNIADSAITVGAGLVILDAIREGQRERQARKRQRPGTE